jgi:hypothetical protein
VRKRNARGDRRHPHARQIDEDPAGQAAGDAARPQSPVETVHGTVEETMPDPVPKSPGRPPAEPIIIKNPSRPTERPEIDRSPEEEPEIKVPPEIIPEMPPLPGPGEQAAYHCGDRALRAEEHLARRRRPRCGSGSKAWEASSLRFASARPKKRHDAGRRDRV